MIAGVLLAAGESRRFGREKLLESYQGEPLATRAARSLLKAGLRPVIVVLPAGSPILKALAGQDLNLVENSEAGLGISHSIALGIDALPEDAGAVLLAVADQPLMDEHIIERLCAAFVQGSIVAARYGAHLGSPRIFDRHFFAELRGLVGDTGGQAVAAAHPEAVIECLLPERAGLDIDRPEDWRKLSG